MLDRLAVTNEKKVKIVKVDASINHKWAGSQNIRGVPAFQFYSGGKLVHQFSGAYPEPEIQKKIDQYTPVAAGAKVAPAKPAIRPMPKNWLPPGVTRKGAGKQTGEEAAESTEMQTPKESAKQ